ncbi:MAG: sugar-binding protein [Myxococcales bacterium]
MLDICAEGEGRCAPTGIEMCNPAGDGYGPASPCSTGSCAVSLGRASCAAAGASGREGSGGAAGAIGCSNTTAPVQPASGGTLGSASSAGLGGTPSGGAFYGSTPSGGAPYGGTTSSGAATGGAAGAATTSGGAGGVSSGGTTSDVTLAGGTPPLGGSVGNGGRVAIGGYPSGVAGGGGATKCAGEAHPCRAIPKFQGSQVVDGNGDDFCQVPAFQFDFSNADKFFAYNEANIHGRGDFPEHVTARIAWSQSYVHAFVRVDDPFIEKAENIEYVYGADSIELMISADDHLSGDVTKDASVMHIIAGPWATSNKGMAASVIGTKRALPDDQYVVTIDEHGYSVELRIPWPDGKTVAAEQRIYFDMAINAAISAIQGQTDVRDAQAIFRVKETSNKESCGQPYCDDLMWCQTKLD